MARRPHSRSVLVSSLTGVVAGLLAIAPAGGATASAAPPVPHAHGTSAPAFAATSHRHRGRHSRAARRRHRHHHPAANHGATIQFQGGQTLSTGRTIKTPQVPAGPCANADLEPASANLALINQATLCLINKERVSRNVTALAENSSLDDAAAHHSNDMIAASYFDHVSPTGETPLDRIRAAGYIVAGAGYEIGENIATGSTGLDTPAQMVAAWMNSPGHRANILNADYTETGLAAVPAMPASFGGGDPGATYTEDFGVIN